MRGIAKYTRKFCPNIQDKLEKLKHKSIPFIFLYCLVMSLTLIHSNIAKIGLSLASKIMAFKGSLKLLAKQSHKALLLK